MERAKAARGLPRVGLGGCPGKVGTSEWLRALPLHRLQRQRERGRPKGTHQAAAVRRVPHARCARLPNAATTRARV